MEVDRWAVEAEARALRLVADVEAAENSSTRATIDQLRASIDGAELAVSGVFEELRDQLESVEEELRRRDARAMRRERDALALELALQEEKDPPPQAPESDRG